MRFKHLALVCGVSIFTIAVDQYSKQVALMNLKGRPMQTFLWDTFRLQYAENNGAFLSLGSSLNESTRFWAFTVLVSLFLGGLLYFLIKKPQLHILETIAYSFVLGGGIGNLIDRWVRSGWVVDFMNMGIGELRTGIFNVADAAIMAGMFILLYRAFVEKRAPK